MMIDEFIELCYLEAKKVERVLELGVCSGDSTKALLRGLRDGKQGHLWSIDWGNIYTAKAVREIRQMGLIKYFTWVKKDFFKIPDEWFKFHPMDLIFVDYDDEDYFEIVRKCVLSMRKGSKLLMHNIIAYPKSREAIIQIMKNREYHYEEILKNHGLGILIKDGLE